MSSCHPLASSSLRVCVLSFGGLALSASVLAQQAPTAQLPTERVGLGSRHIVAVALFGSGAAVKFQQEADALHVTLPAKPAGESAYVIRIALDGPATPSPR